MNNPRENQTAQHKNMHSGQTDAARLAYEKTAAKWGNVKSRMGKILESLLGAPNLLAKNSASDHTLKYLREALKEAVEIHQVQYRNRLIAADILESLSVQIHTIEKIEARQSEMILHCGSIDSESATSDFGINLDMIKARGGLVGMKAPTLVELRKLYRQISRAEKELSNIQDQLPELRNVVAKKKGMNLA